jgi:hypothetical protein
MVKPSAIRKLALSAHVALTVGWLGALAAFLVLAIAGISIEGPANARSTYVAMELIALYVLLPIAVGSLVSGIVQSLITPWGLLRHYWVVVKLLITAVALIVFLLQLGSISDLADAARSATLIRPRYDAARVSLVVHAGGGLVILLVPLFLSIFKPRGITPLGRRALARA